MAKKQYTPEEYKAKTEKRAEKSKRFFTAFFKVVALCLAIVIVYSTTAIAFTRTSLYGVISSNSVVAGNQGSNNDYVDNSGDLGNNNTNNDVQAPSTDNSGDSSDNTANNNGGNTNNDNSNNNNTDNQDKPSADSSKNEQEYLDMYKKAVANARTKSSSVVRVKDGAINYKGIVEAGSLSSIASMLMGMFMAADENAIEVKNEAWQKEDIPDATALTLNGIQKITREDKGDTYVITVVAKDATNPKEGADGVGAISGVIEDSQITGAIGSVPLLELNNINIAYENVTVVATVDKATGNLVELKVNAPCTLGLDAKLPLVGSINGAKVGIQVITEYTFAY